MQNDTINPRASNRDLRVINYRPLGAGQDFKRSLNPAPKRVAPAPIQPTVAVPPSAKPIAAPVKAPVAPVKTVVPPQAQPSKPISRPLAKALPKETKQKKRRFSLGQGIAMLAVAGILGITGYVFYDTWTTNKDVKETVSQASTDTSVLGEGTDETSVSASAVDAYRVSADLPRVLTIESLGIRSRILPMSVTNAGAIQAPTNIFDSGWYTGSAKPGTPGASLIDAHASGATREGLFAYLDKLKEGDKITIERGSGEILTYSVVHTETIDLGTVDMSKMLETYGDVKEGINLITCSGTWKPDEKTYDKRVLVYTERI